MNVHHDAATPTLSVIDPRSLMIRSVGYCRHPDLPDIDPRITRQVFDAAGRQIAAWDPRLWGTAPKPNLATTYGLSGQALLTDSVDAGWQLSLPDQAGSSCCSWDARGSACHREYDDLQRPIVVTEQARGEQPYVVERLTYASAGDAFAQHNQCGRLIRHDDPAGTRLLNDYGLAGAELVESRRLLTNLDLPDWPSDPEHRDVFLEEQSYVTRYAFYPTGELQHQTDAMGNVQTRQYNVAGELSATWLLPTGEGKQPKCLVSDIRYNAHEQIEHETAGNGVMTRAEYSPEDGRLLKLSAAVGEQTPLQNLHYVYDPVGNIVSLEDKTQAVTYFNQQRIEPVSRYRYDSLYQLVETKGWEVSQPSHGPALPELLPTPLDPNQRRNYTQTFDYDAAGNLLTRHHSGAPGFSMFTSAYSNRSLAQRDDGSLPGETDIVNGFDACGNQLELLRGQGLRWDVRNQLSQATLVSRQAMSDDNECYQYDRLGHRLRKLSFSRASGRAMIREVRYLPGLELRLQIDGEVHHVISIEAGRSAVQMLHWPNGAHADQWRYSYGELLDSSMLELDAEAGVITQEHYYPFGGTACWAGKSVWVAKYKTVRYSGKERDATGLYYFGFRYYAPWLQRWINPDPTWDGPNAYQMLGNNPVNSVDPDGLSKSDAQSRWRSAYAAVVASQDGVRVRTVAPGIIAVDIQGRNELLNRMGMGLTRPVRGDRKLSYLSIASSLRGKVAGAEQGIRLNTVSGEAIKAQAGLNNAGAVAYINGGFFNIANLGNKHVSPFAPIGPSVIGGTEQVYAPVPSDYKKYYTSISMRDGSKIQSGPVLSNNGQPAFPQSWLGLTKFLFDPKNNQPGKLGHAGAPNSRSGISLPGTSGPGQRTRLALGLSDGRSEKATGYTMPEWSLVMARLDGMNSGGGRAVNLDGGYSAGIGVVGANGQSLMRRPEEAEPRSIANFIAYYEKPPTRSFFKKLFS
ncbi:RHS repeat-associated core domain-containing protein [Pseudomonas crudilactis]|uniref:RHS repeat-associated core domain-containing protein n=1 Tax=Pseudomonas crudilactis TaxID=2697028 RepID=UPI0015D9C39B|nr:RHS repeat-associated core domain-containing protein [Pseudomonas crudilactis]